MKRNVLSKLSLVVAIVCVLAMLPIVSVSAAAPSVTSATAGGVDLSASDASPVKVTRDKVFAVTVAADANTELTIMSNVNGDLATDKIAYINQENSGTGTKTFTFTLRDGIPLGKYVVSVGGEGVATPIKKYFELVDEVVAEKSITITSPVRTVTAGQKVILSGTVEGCTSMTVELYNGSTKIPCLGSATISDTVFTATLVTNQSMAAGSYTIKLTDGAVTTSQSVNVNKAATSTKTTYGDVTNEDFELIPDGQVTTDDSTMVLYHATGKVRIGGQAFKNGDVAEEFGILDTDDAIAILKKAMGM